MLLDILASRIKDIESFYVSSPTVSTGSTLTRPVSPTVGYPND